MLRHPSPHECPHHSAAACPGVLRNAGYASSVCDEASRNYALQKITGQTEDPRIEMARAHYLIRHTMLAYDHPQHRPAVSSELLACTKKMHTANQSVAFFLVSSASEVLRFSLGLHERRPDVWSGGIPDPRKDPYRLVERWNAVHAIFAEVEFNHRRGSVETVSFDVSDSDLEDD